MFNLLVIIDITHTHTHTFPPDAIRIDQVQDKIKIQWLQKEVVQIQKQITDSNLIYALKNTIMKSRAGASRS